MPASRALLLLLCSAALCIVGFAEEGRAAGKAGSASPFTATPPAYQRYPANTTVPTAPAPPKTAAPAETRGKYADPYDRRIPLQGDTHKEYTGGKKDPYQRAK